MSAIENDYTCDEKCECTHCQRNRPTYEEDECCECVYHGDDGCKCDCHSEEDDMKSHPCECGLKECSDCFPEEDGDGFVICSKCGKGGGKCDGECEESK